jgi:hypothetical protein
MDPMSLFVTSLAGAAGKTAASEGMKVLRQLIGLEEAQVRLLKALELKIDALLARPFYAGRQHLRYALEPWRNPADRDQLLYDARRLFTEAVSQDLEPLRRSLAHVHLACVWLALDSPNDVPLELRNAHMDALRSLRGFLGRPVDGVAAVRLRLDKGARSEREFKVASEIMPYANGLARIRRSWGAPFEQAPIFVGASVEGETIEESMVQGFVAERAMLEDLIERQVPPERRHLFDLPAFPKKYTSRPVWQEVHQQVQRGEIVHYHALEEWLQKHEGSKP